MHSIEFSARECMADVIFLSLFLSALRWQIHWQINSNRAEAALEQEDNNYNNNNKRIKHTTPWKYLHLRIHPSVSLSLSPSSMRLFWPLNAILHGDGYIRICEEKKMQFIIFCRIRFFLFVCNFIMTILTIAVKSFVFLFLFGVNERMCLCVLQMRLRNTFVYLQRKFRSCKAILFVLSDVRFTIVERV